MLAQVCDPSTRKTEVGGSRAQDQSGLCETMS